MIFPYMDILENWGSKYALTTLAAKRAKQIKDGSSPLIRTESRNPLTIALEEIAQGKVKCEIPDIDIVLPESVEPDVTALLSIPIDSELVAEHLDEHEEELEAVEEEEELALTPEDELEDEGETLEEELVVGGLHEEEDESGPVLFGDEVEDSHLDPVGGPLALGIDDEHLEDEVLTDEEEDESEAASEGRSRDLDEELEESIGEMFEDVDQPESEEDLE